MATEQDFSVSVVEDVLQNHRLNDLDLASRMAGEASLRRYEAAAWLRKMVGVVAGKDLPAQPSESEFRLGLRSGIILCSVLNKVQEGAVPKVVESPCGPVDIPDGAALSAYQYFENIRNFLVAVGEMGLPSFEASDLEQGGKTSRIVNCVLALKSYNDWKQGGSIGSWKFGGNAKSSTTGKQIVRKNSEPFTNSLLRTLTPNSLDSLTSELSICSDIEDGGTSNSLNTLVRAALLDKKQEEIPIVVASMLNRVIQEFDRRLANRSELVKGASKDVAVSAESDSSPDSVYIERMAEDETPMEIEEVPTEVEEEIIHQDRIYNEMPRDGPRKSTTLVEKQRRDVEELKYTLHMTKEGMKCFQFSYLEELNNLGNLLHGMALAASGYRKVLEENRKLYNQVQDLKGNIRVYCRVRPFLTGQPNRMSSVGHIEEGTITIITPSKYGKEGRKLFTFNKVFGPSASQAEVFCDTQPLIRSVLDGYNVCIFAYGQTGSGKTHTMSGPNELTEETMGVNYRALNDLFVLSDQRKETISYVISVQMMEIYNEQVRDLLVSDGVNKKVEIWNSSQNGINVPEANLVPVSSTSDVINLMNLGHKNRTVGATAMNDRSSRSHSCLTVHVQGRDLASGNTLRGCMHLVDLAGSERVDKSEVTGDRLKEAQHINKSLSALGDVISSLSLKNTHVPYRNSKLTQLLQDALGGQAKTLMFVHISPEPDAIGETISTLKFAERVSTVELGAARANKDGTDVKELKEQVASLKTALAKKEGGAEKLSNSRPSSPIIGLSRIRSLQCISSDKDGGDISSNQRRPLDDSTKVEVRSITNLRKPRRRSLDPQELSTNSSRLPRKLELNTKDTKESGSGDWVDKLIVNKHGSVNRDENPGCLEEDNTQSSETSSQTFSGDQSKPYFEQLLGTIAVSNKDTLNNMQKTQSEMTTADDSDETETATSDSSDQDLLSQLNLPKSTNISNGLGSRVKKMNSKTLKGADMRSHIPSLIPSIRKVPNGMTPSVHRLGRQPISVDGKRKGAHAK